MNTTRAGMAGALKEGYGMAPIKQFDRTAVAAGAGPVRSDVNAQRMGKKGHLCPRCGKGGGKGYCKCGTQRIRRTDKGK